MPQLSLIEDTLIGNGITNLRLGSIVELQGEAIFRVKYQFVPVSRGPYASLAVGATSNDLIGGMVYFRPKSTRLLLNTGRLCALKNSYYLDSTGKRIDIQANIVEFWNVKSGDTVDLYFALDALQENRQHPLYTLGPVYHHCVVTIFEKPGKLSHLPNLTIDYIDEQGTAWYSGALTGDTWKECCPPFTLDQARAILSKAGFNHPVVDAAMQEIYGGGITFVPAANEYRLDLTVPPIGSAPASNLRLVWHSISWGPTSNPAKNIASFDPKCDVEMRVHPYAYAAVISAAVKCEIQAVQLNSSWRPMLAAGMGHRNADSLDVGALTDKAGTVYQFRWDTLTPAEQAKLDTLRAAKQKEAERNAEYTTMQKAYNKLKLENKRQKEKTDQLLASKLRDAEQLTAVESKLAMLESQPKATLPKAKATQEIELAKTKKYLAKQQEKVSTEQTQYAAAAEKLRETEAKLKQAEQELESTRVAAEKATAEREQASTDWQAIVDTNLPEVVSRFRDELFANPFVRQIIDPWEIDYNTRDRIAPNFNERRSDVEIMHLNHLHITCAYPELLQFS